MKLPPLRLVVLGHAPPERSALLAHLQEPADTPHDCRVVLDADQAERCSTQGPWDAIVLVGLAQEAGVAALLSTLRGRLGGVPLLVVARGVGDDNAADLVRLRADAFLPADRLQDFDFALAQIVGARPGPPGSNVPPPPCIGDRAQSGAVSEASSPGPTPRPLDAAEIRSTLQPLAEAFVILTEDQVVESVNPSAESILGYREHELKGSRFLSIVPEPQMPRLAEALVDCGAPPGMEPVPTPHEVFLTRRDGSLMAVEILFTRVFLRPDKPLIIASLRDVFGRRRGDEERFQADKMEALGRLASGVAHDFNNMLTATTGFCQLLLLKMSAADPNRKFAEQILKACDHAAQLTRQLLAFGRKQVSNPEVLDVNSVLRQSEMMLGRILGDDVRLRIVTAPENLSVSMDRTQLEQIIVNLAANARDAMPRGGTLTLEAAGCVLGDVEARRRVRLHPGPFVLLTVVDSGEGMDESVRARIFEPFFTTKGRGRGTGLGLATVYSILDRAGGFVEVTSTPGEGSRFDILLPRVADAPTQSPSAAITDDTPHGTEWILVAEDEEMVRSLVTGVLESSGYTVKSAGSGEEALQVALRADRRFDLLLTDVVMPGMNGYDLSERIRARFPGIRVLYMSGHTESGLLRRGVATGAIAFLQKPFTPVRLAQSVRDVLDEA